MGWKRLFGGVSEETKLTVPGQEVEINYDRAEFQHGMNWLKFCEGQL